ncbi:sugar phosphate isomerase/epimerase family protein [Oceaniglobus trochenteri]|uniref:sugar phosphate isomerase/epimerase family protein n=1 Tax=Oceaniglobus trochenteri TaxID=2763260 RepID=UPI001CFFE955|nr:sugar phosphate isomerase/epimerase family protein [Oceaniglobus trochenteri]
MKNPIGIISMQFVRPFTGAHLHLFHDIKAMGFDFIELLVPEPEDGIDLAKAKGALAEAGLGVVLAARVNPARSISSEDAAARQGGLDYLKSCIDSAAALGATIIGGPLYGEPMVFAGRPPLPRTADEMKARADRMIAGLAEVAPLARAAGQVFALEPLNRFETDMLNTTQQGIAVVDAVGDTGLGLMLDTFHMNMEDQSIPDAIRLAGSRTVHFQANENHRGFPGTGNMDWPAIMRALHQVGYDGPISLEPFRRDDQRLALPIAQWRAPAEDETAKLKAGCALIRAARDFAEFAQ